MPLSLALGGGHWLLSPLTLGLLGLLTGALLATVASFLPRLLETLWLGEAAAQLTDQEALRAQGGLDAASAASLSTAASGLCRRLESQDLRAAPRCVRCGHRLRWHERLPVIGWLLLRGRCPRCEEGLPQRSLVLELGTGVLFAAISWRFDAQPVAILWCAFAAALVTLTAIDWETKLLPDAITLPLLWAGLGAAALGATVPVADAILGAVLGYLSLWSIYWAYRLATGQEGMGRGDFKLLAALGAWFGWQMVAPILMVAAIVGALGALVLMAVRRGRAGLRIPFGPYLATGGLLVLFVGPHRLLALAGQV